MKKWIALLLIACLLVPLCACHNSKPLAAFVPPETFDTSRQYTITFWAKNESNQNQVAIYQQAVEDFEALYPNIHVELKTYTNYGDIYNDVITNIPTKTTPNVCITYPDHIATYTTGGDSTVVPLDQLFTHEKYGFGGSELRYDGPTQEQIVPKFLEECRIDSGYYAIPYMRSTEACYINKTYVEKLGYTLPETLTWDFVWEVSEAAMAKNEDGTFQVNGQKTMIPFIYKSTDNMMIQMLQQKGAGYSTADAEVLMFNETTKDILRTIGQHSVTRAFDTFKSVSYPANYLNKGQCIFAIDSTAGATWMGPDAPLTDISQDSLVEFETVAMAVPQFDTENPKMISQGPSVCIFNKEDSQEVLASWLFAQYLLTDEVQIAYAQTEGYVPVTSKAQESDVYQDYLSREGEDNDLHYFVKLQATKLLLNNTDNTFVTPVFNGSASLRNAAGELIEQTRKAARRGEKIDDAYFDGLFAEMTALYRLDQVGAVANSKQPLKPLSGAAIGLLAGLGVVWCGIGVYALRNLTSKKKSQKD